jgi:hypothetical protein
VATRNLRPARRRQGTLVMKKKQKKQTPCLTCGRLSPETICLACRNRIQGEAIDKKQEVEKKGRTDKGRV